MRVAPRPHFKMNPFFFLFTAILANGFDAKETEKITIGLYTHKEVGQLSIPLNNIIHKSNYERRKISFNITTEEMPDGDPFKASKVFCSMIEKTPRLVAILVSESSTASRMVQSISAKLDLPYIQTSWRQSGSYSGSQTSLNFYPDFDLVAVGLAKLVESLQWPSFVVLYETFDGFLRLQEVLKLHQIETKNLGNVTVAKKLDFKENVKATLKQLRQAGEKRIILDCEIEHMMQVLEHCKELGMMSFAHNYFLSSMDAHTLDLEGLAVDANITTVRVVNPESSEDIVSEWENTEYLNMRNIDLKPYDVYTESMLVYDAVNLLKEAVNSLQQEEDIAFNNISCKTWEKFGHGPQIISLMSSSYKTSSSSSPFPIFDPVGRRANFTLSLIEGNREKVIATWDSANKSVNVIRTAEESRIKQVESLQSGVVIISSRLERPYLMLKKDSHLKKGNDKYEGYILDLMTAIATKLHFNFSIEVVDVDGSYNELTNTWDGIIGEIISERALFGIGDLTITPMRERYVDFSMPFMRLGVGILLQKPQIPVNMFAFINPLSKEVWMYTITLYLTLSIILYFVARMAPGDWENPHPCNLNPEELENIWGIKNCLWLAMGSIMNQGSDILPRGISSRLVTSMWWLFALIMTNSYIASLAAFLTTKASVIDDLEDLAKQNRIKYGTLKVGSTRDFFKQSNYSTYRRMYANMELNVPSVYAETTYEGVHRVQTTLDGSYAFLMESSTIEYLTERNCDLTTVDDWFNNIEYGIAMVIGCPYRTIINDAILDFQESGKLNDLKNFWWRGNTTASLCPPDAEGGDELKMENVGGIFVVLFVGVAVALLFGIMEFLWTARQTSIEKHITYWQAFKSELAFSLKIWISKKKAQQSDLNNLSTPNKEEDSEWEHWETNHCEET